jgi:hypothetical protein
MSRVPREGPSDDNVINQAREALSHCSPPIPCETVEAGSFADGATILALIQYLKDGNAILNTTKIKIFHLQDLLLRGLQSVADRRDVPFFRIEEITGRNKAATAKLLRWILDFRKSAPLSAHLKWVLEMGITSGISAETIAAIAEQFGLRGEPIGAFRAAGIALPDDPAAAISMLFRAAGKKMPGAIQFVHDEASAADLARIQSTVAGITGIARSKGETLIGEEDSMADILREIEAFKDRFARICATTELREQTNKSLQAATDSLKEAQRSIEHSRRREKQLQDQTRQNRWAEFEQKAIAAEQGITEMFRLLERKTGSTVAEMEKRVKSLTKTMTSAADMLRVAESDENRVQERIESLQRKFKDASQAVTAARTDLEQLIPAKRSHKVLAHSRFRADIKRRMAEVENAIDGRSGDLNGRLMVLDSQRNVLDECKYRVIHDGIRLDEDLEKDGLKDFESIGGLQEEIRQLRSKRDLALREENEIENRRQRYIRCQEDAEKCFHEIEGKIGSLVEQPLLSARKSLQFLVDSRARIEGNLKSFNLALTK